MIKIIAAIDGLDYSSNTVDYSIHIAKQTGAHLVGIFLDDRGRHSYTVRQIQEAGGPADHIFNVFNERDREIRRGAVKIFEEACQQHGLAYSLHHDRNIAVNELLHESIYADLLIIDAKTTFTNYAENAPSNFMRDLLGEVKCPVLAVPETFRPFEKMVVLYDGKPASVFATKMASYTKLCSPELTTEVITVAQDGNSHVPDNRLMKEFMKRHFPHTGYTVLKGDPEEEIPAYLSKENHSTIVVLGAYNRGLVSRWMRRSMADVLLAQCNLPLFIAHD